MSESPSPALVTGPASAGPEGVGAEWMLVDGSSLIFRAFFGVPRTMRGPDGVLNNAIRGFLDLLARLVTDRHPRRLLIASDEDWRPAWRVALIPGYKAHRVAEPVPPELAPRSRGRGLCWPRSASRLLARAITRPRM